MLKLEIASSIKQSQTINSQKMVDEIENERNIIISNNMFSKMFNSIRFSHQKVHLFSFRNEPLVQIAILCQSSPEEITPAFPIMNHNTRRHKHSLPQAKVYVPVQATNLMWEVNITKCSCRNEDSNSKSNFPRRVESPSPPSNTHDNNLTVTSLAINSSDIEQDSTLSDLIENTSEISSIQTVSRRTEEELPTEFGYL